MSFTIKGTGSALPKLVVTNDDLSRIVDTSDEWITTRTGVKERRVLSDETLTDLALEAAEKAMADAGVKPEELDFILCATIRGDVMRLVFKRNIHVPVRQASDREVCEGR